MIATELSPLFGLTFMELVTIVAISTIISGAAATFALIVTAIKSTKDSKVSSANLIMRFLDTLREDRFKQLWRDIVNLKKKEYDPEILSPYLNTFEEIAVFTKEKTLDINHVIEFYGSHLKKIRDDEFIKKYIQEKSDKSEGFAFSKLNWLLDRAESKYFVVGKLKELFNKIKKIRN